MCMEPMTALAIASSVASVVGQQQAANAQAATNQRQYENTIRAYNANVNQTNLMAAQEREAAVQKLNENNSTARAAQAKATVAAGESGISGLSVDALLGDMSFKQNEFSTSVNTNLERANSAIQRQRDNAYFSAASTINELKTPAMPDYFGSALKIGTSLKGDQKFQKFIS